MKNEKFTWDGKGKVLGIDQIIEVDANTLEVEASVGTDKEALVNAMQKLANEKNKTVKAKFNEEELVVEPEGSK